MRREQLRRFRRVFAKGDVRSISRRYFVANGFDGTLTSIGVVVGTYLAGVTDGFAVIGIGLGAAVGLGTSGVWSVWEIERAEALAERRRVEAAMVTDLEGTRIERDHRTAQIIHASASATGPVLAILLTLAPFLLVDVVLSLAQAVVVSVLVGIAILATFGAYMGSISEQRWYVTAVRMGLAGVVVAAINVFLPG